MPSRGKRWRTSSVYQVLQRAGHAVREYRQDTARVQPAVIEIKRDKQAAAARAVQLRAQRLSLRDIGARLLGEGLLPARGAQWYAATVLDLLPRMGDRGSRVGAARSPKAACSRNLHGAQGPGRSPASRAAALGKVKACQSAGPTRAVGASSRVPARRAAPDARPRLQAG